MSSETPRLGRTYPHFADEDSEVKLMEVKQPGQAPLRIRIQIRHLDLKTPEAEKEASGRGCESMLGSLVWIRQPILIVSFSCAVLNHILFLLGFFTFACHLSRCNE